MRVARALLLAHHRPRTPAKGPGGGAGWARTLVRAAFAFNFAYGRDPGVHLAVSVFLLRTSEALWLGRLARVSASSF